MPLSDSQIERYSRQIILPEVGSRGQHRLLQAAVAVIGDGRLGYTVVSYLTAAGVGRITWCVSEAVLPTDRKRLYDDLSDLNPDVAQGIERLDPAAENGVLADTPYALVISIPADSLGLTVANALAIRRRVPLLVGLAHGQTGWMAAFTGRPCASCWDVPWPRSTAAGDGSAAAGVISSLVALAALELLLGIGAARCGVVLQYDGRTSKMTESPVAARPGCSACPSAPRTHP